MPEGCWVQSHSPFLHLVCPIAAGGKRRPDSSGEEAGGEAELLFPGGSLSSAQLFPFAHLPASPFIHSNSFIHSLIHSPSILSAGPWTHQQVQIGKIRVELLWGQEGFRGSWLGAESPWMSMTLPSAVRGQASREDRWTCKAVGTGKTRLHPGGSSSFSTKAVAWEGGAPCVTRGLGLPSGSMYSISGDGRALQTPR